MKKRTWVILGATSAIAEAFAHCAAQKGHHLMLVGRHHEQLAIIGADIRLRYQVHCDTMTVDLAEDISPLLNFITYAKNLDLFIAHSVIAYNETLNTTSLHTLLTTNVTHTIQLIHAYWHKKQTQHAVIFLSSVAACKGRAKNSLYGASKAAVEVYLQGLQQGALNTQHITIARLGYIDTHVTYGEPGLFYASPPSLCAKACWQAYQSKKRMIYHPFFWQYIMGVIKCLPFLIYKRLQF